MNYTLEKQIRYDELYLDIATRISRESVALRYKVGCVLVEESGIGNIVSFGWNGMPAGKDNACEVDSSGQLMTLEQYYEEELNISDLTSNHEVQHAEENLIDKMPPLRGDCHHILYLTHEPCTKCAKLIVREIPTLSRVVYRYVYAPDPQSPSYGKESGTDVFKRNNIKVQHLS